MRLDISRYPSLRLTLVLIAAGGLAAGTLAWLGGAEAASRHIFAAATLPVLAGLLVEIVTSLRRGEVGLDLVAALAMTAALAFDEALAGNVVALMYAGGQLLETFAEGRARKEMTALLGRVARTARRYSGSTLEDVAIETLRVGDRVLVRRGEVVPADGRLVSPYALLDESALTGESVPAPRTAGSEILSGSSNAGDAFDCDITRPASESTYANIVRLVEEAQTRKAPSVRMADRYAVAFLALTLVIAGLAWWLSGDPVRALAVLVVATPCPLILALPVAIISGMSRAARIGVLMKNGGAIEALARIRTIVLDKTGTLTLGEAQVSDIRIAPGWDEGTVLRLAASLDQASGHVIAEALVKAARQRGLALSMPANIQEIAGSGLSGMVDGYHLSVGGLSLLEELGIDTGTEVCGAMTDQGAALVAVAVDGCMVGLIQLADPPRPDAPAALARLHEAGITRIVLASGDRQDVVDRIAENLGIGEAIGTLSPSGKAEIVARESARAPTAMVGDGVNDAPALASATVGIAMGARGSAASAESADVVLLVDRIDRLADALAIAHRTRRIARQSVLVGLGLSIVAMIVAAFGLLPPVAGALTQEVIDVAVILNALRALR